MEQLRPQLQRLREQQEAAGGPYPGAEVGSEGVFDREDPETGWQDALDNLDLGTLDLDLGAFDGLADALSGVDFGGGGAGGGGGGSGA